MVQQASIWRIFTRRKVLADEGADTDTKLNRVLGLYDLTALGVGSTLGAGVYVLAGKIARDQAGPSVMISFAIAALASLLAGICYAEFGARVPKAGSAYIYSYVCIGEFVAFVIGWNLILEYMIGTASVCRGISLYLDTLINDTLKTTFAEIAPMHVSFLGSYFDFFAFGLVVVFGVALAFGVKTSAMANNFCTGVNICILLFVIIAGAMKANIDNWNIDASMVNATDVNVGVGGFFPFGFTGTLKGAATCFFGFVGFDCIATTGEEVRNPRRNIPRSILLSLLIIFLCYFGVSTVLTLMVPYYLQDPNAPLPYAFKEVGWMFAMWIVSIGGLIGLLASLLGALFPLPRIMYAMAEDGLLFRFLGKVSVRFRVPVVGSIFAAILTALIAGLFDLDHLVNLLSIGTLLAYSVVAISVTLLRYMDNSDEGDSENGAQPPTENSLLTSSGMRVTCGSIMAQLFNCQRLHTPNILSTRIVGTLISLFCLLSLGIGLLLMHAYDALIQNQIWVLALLGVLVGLTGLVLLAICLQPRELYSRLFRVPFVPIIPAISIFINIYLMLQLDTMTWYRFGIWMIIGVPMFIACWCMYDIKNPAKHNPMRIEFAKALKESGASPSKSANGLRSVPIIITEDCLNGSESNIHNQHSVKSLDEIQNLNDCSEELIECKHPNGKVFYVEDTRSTISTAGSLQNEAQRDAVTADDEKSVMAMLDDVLQAEDNYSVMSPSGESGVFVPPDYSRKISVDSEMLPSVIETTIVATVHSSDSSDQTDLEDVPESAHEESRYSSDEYMEKQLIAKELVDNLLSSAELWEAVEERRKIKDLELSLRALLIKEIRNHSPATTPLKRSPSVGSITSKASTVDEDAVHSEKFKLKLSKLILQQPLAIPMNNIPVQDAEDSKMEETRSPIKHSKSENDLRKMVLKAIEATNLNIDANLQRQNFREDSGEPNNDIPKPPKFDPVLYKTINSLSFNRERPGLDKLLDKDKESKTTGLSVHDEEPIQKEPELSFKEKLEAMLKRGPSHYSQKRPEVTSTRPKSMGAFSLEGNSVEAQVTTKSENNLTKITGPNITRSNNDVSLLEESRQEEEVEPLNA